MSAFFPPLLFLIFFLSNWEPLFLFPAERSATKEVFLGTLQEVRAMGQRAEMCRGHRPCTCMGCFHCLFSWGWSVWGLPGTLGLYSSHGGPRRLGISSAVQCILTHCCWSERSSSLLYGLYYFHLTLSSRNSLEPLLPCFLDHYKFIIRLCVSCHFK